MADSSTEGKVVYLPESDKYSFDCQHCQYSVIGGRGDGDWWVIKQMFAHEQEEHPNASLNSEEYNEYI